MAENNKSIYLLAIICIVAIVSIVYFVGNYVYTHPVVGSSIMLDSSGQAYAGTNAKAPKIMEYTITEPCAYRYVVNNLPKTTCPRD